MARQAISSTRPTPTDRDSMEGVTIDLPAQGSNVLNEGNKDRMSITTAITAGDIKHS